MNFRPPASRPHKSPVHTVKEHRGAEPPGSASRDISSREPPIVARFPGLSTTFRKSSCTRGTRSASISDARADKDSVIVSRWEVMTEEWRYTAGFHAEDPSNARRFVVVPDRPDGCIGQRRLRGHAGNRLRYTQRDAARPCIHGRTGPHAGGTGAWPDGPHIDAGRS